MTLTLASYLTVRVRVLGQGRQTKNNEQNKMDK